MYALSFNTMSLWNLHCCARFTMQKLEFIELDLPKHIKQGSTEAPVWTQMSGSSTHLLCSTTLCVSSEMEAAAIPPSVWRKNTWHITLQRKELEPLQMKVRMLYLHWMFLAFLFSTYQASRDGAGTSLFCSIPFKHATSGKRETRSSQPPHSQILAS